MNAVVLGISTAGVLVGILAAAVSRSFRIGVAVVLELWLAAGLLRLTANMSWSAILTATALVTLRKGTAWTLGRLANAQRGTANPTGGA